MEYTDGVSEFLSASPKQLYEKFNLVGGGGGGGEDRPQSKELVRGPPELVQQFGL
jgi:hypothetical protein